MARSSLRSLDGFAKTVEEFRIRTWSGGLITILSACLVILLTTLEWRAYRTKELRQELLVDNSRGGRLAIHFDITFPRIPCYLVNIDLTDAGGEHQQGDSVWREVTKTRLAADGAVIKKEMGEDDRKNGAVGGSQVAMVLANGTRSDTSETSLEQCGSCYGGIGPESGCCNTCAEVRAAYLARGWTLQEPDAIEQCRREGYSQRIREQADEGCHLVGVVHVNKVPGQFHVSPGHSFKNAYGIGFDIVEYLRDQGKHDFRHTINAFSFDLEEEESKPWTGPQGRKLVRSNLLKIIDPLDGTTATTAESLYVYQYFLKVVSSRYFFLDGMSVAAVQYSSTKYEHDISGKTHPGEEGHSTVMHSSNNLPGLFFTYDVSALLILYKEHRQSLIDFLTSLCAIIGGVLTLASFVDSIVFFGERKLKEKAEMGKTL